MMHMKLTPDLGEFIGIYIGDGFTNKYGNHYIVEFSGNKKTEINYFKKTLIPLTDGIFHVKPHLTIRENSIRLRYNSKRIFESIIELGLLYGKKSDKVIIPGYLLKHKNILKRILRGIFDTDGTIFWDNRRIYKKPYPRLSITTISRKLSLQLENVLNELGFSVYRNEFFWKRRSKKVYHIDLYGINQFKKWKREIGFSNPKNILKSRMPR